MENPARMAVAQRGTASNYLQRAPSPSGLADVLDVILDKGLVLDAYVRISAIGIELVTIDARIVIASVDTYLRFAEAVNRLDLTQTELAGLPELQEQGAEKLTEGAIEGAEEKVVGKEGSTLRKAVTTAAAGAAAASAPASEPAPPFARIPVPATRLAAFWKLVAVRRGPGGATVRLNAWLKFPTAAVITTGPALAPARTVVCA